MTRRKGDDGQLVLLTVFFGFVAALLTVVVVDASAAFLAHRALAGLADGAALAAAQSVDIPAYYRTPGDELPLGDVETAAAQYVADHGEGTELHIVAIQDGAVRITLRRRVRFALAAAVLPHETEIEATATARLVTRA